MTRTFAIGTLTVGLGLLVSAPLAAQQPTEADMAAMMEAVSPDEHHAVLEQLVGSWNHAIKFYAAPGAPAADLTATSVAEMSMGGRYLVTEFSGDFMGAPFEGREVMGYDKVKGKYFALWHDNMSTGPMISWGSWDPATKTMTMEGTGSDPMSGNPDLRIRNTTQLLDDGSVHYENWGPGPDGESFKSMEIHSTRQP
jgi:hypothetical protein